MTKATHSFTHTTGIYQMLAIHQALFIEGFERTSERDRQETTEQNGVLDSDKQNEDNKMERCSRVIGVGVRCLGGGMLGRVVKVVVLG